MNRPAAATLIVRGDDFGVCHAVNEGIVKAYREGILSVASTMAPGPWFPEAARLAVEHGIPCGIHVTLTCEWPNLRWGPLTAGGSLAREDGTMWDSVAEAGRHAVPAEIRAEIEAQAARFRGAGLKPAYMDYHMGVPHEATFRELSASFNNAGFDGFASVEGLSSPKPAEEKTDWLLAYLDRLGPGRHLLVSHPAVDSPELEALAPATHPVHPWAKTIRVSDLAALTDPRVKDAVARLGISLIKEA